MLATTLTMSSCFTQKVTTDVKIPIATNTINSVELRELNLQHGSDYTITNTVSADATVVYTTQKKGKKIKITEETGEFSIVYEYDEKNGKMKINDYDGVARFGFLNNDYDHIFTNVIAPEHIVSSLAIYRLINQAKVRGADGIIEPIVSTSAEADGHNITFKTTATAKLMKLNVDSK